MSIKHTHIYEAFLDASKKRPQNSSVLFKKNGSYHSLSYEDLHSKALQFGNYLKRKGFKKNDRIALCLGNQPEFIIAFMAIMYNKAVAVPIDNQFSPEEVKYLLSHAEADCFVLTQKSYTSFKDVLRGVDAVIIDSPDLQNALKEESLKDNFVLENASKEDLAMLFYTSGTTDNPKAVMLTHNNLLFNINSLMDLHLISEGDRMLSMLPLHHSYSFTVTLLLPLFSMATIVYPPGIASSDLLSCLKETDLTIFVGVPQVFSLIHRSIIGKINALPFTKKIVMNLIGNILNSLRKISGINLNKSFFSKIHEPFGKGLRFMISGGARLDVSVAKDFYKWGFIILEGYGLTETSPVVTFNNLDKNRIGSAGRAILDVDIKIEKDNADDPEGEVAIKGPNVMAGYYKMEGETKKVIKDGWFYSGDVGYIDKDGFLFLTGRKKEIIVSSAGKNIYPEEVEKHYSSSPLIKEICVVEVKLKSAFTEATDLGAVIIINEDYFKEKVVTGVHDKVKWEIDNLSIKLPSYKRIKSFVISQNELPRTRLGKLMRYKAKDIFEKLSRENDSKKDWMAAENQGRDLSCAAKIALDFIEKALGRKVTLKDHLELDLGLDSLAKVEMLLGIQEKLDLKMTDEQSLDFLKHDTVEELLNTLEGLTLNKVIVSGTEEAISWDKILKENVSDEIKNKVSLRMTFLGLVLNILFIVFFKVFFRLFYLLRTEGKENFAKKGPFIITPNHCSYLDGLFILTAIPFGILLKTYFVGMSDVFDSPLLKKVGKTARLISTDAKTNLVDSLKACVYVLNNSGNVCYFPEGQRSIDGEVKEFKKGIGILIKETDCKVIPAYIEGSFHTWPRHNRFPRLYPVKVKFGKPLNARDLTGEKDPNDDPYRTIAENLREKVAGLND